MASSGPALRIAPHKVVERLTAARELGLGSRGPDPKGPWAALDALGGEPGVALELGDETGLCPRCHAGSFASLPRRGKGPSAIVHLVEQEPSRTWVLCAM
jgi:hypothetical protein